MDPFVFNLEGFIAIEVWARVSEDDIMITRYM